MDSILNSFNLSITGTDVCQFIEALVSALEMKDYFCKGNALRVAGISALIGNELELSEDDMFWLYVGGYLHDIGKIGVSDTIVKKRGALTIPEYTEMKKHPLIGEEIISKIDLFAPVLPIIRSHHERVDGKGYPDSISGADFGVMPRIVSVADSIDAMASHRGYRRAMPWSKVKFELQSHAGTQFDNKIVFIAVKIFNEWTTEEWNDFFSTFSDIDIVEVDYGKLMNERL